MKTFQTLGLSKGLSDAVQLIGFETPTPIQEQAIPLLLAGNRDFIGLAQTGTGKPQPSVCRCLILLMITQKKHKH